jgi:hypothetical protein
MTIPITRARGPLIGIYGGAGGELSAPLGPIGGPGVELSAPLGPIGGPGVELSAPLGPIGGPGVELSAPLGPIGGPGVELSAPLGPIGGPGVSLRPPGGCPGAFLWEHWVVLGGPRAVLERSVGGLGLSLGRPVGRPLLLGLPCGDVRVLLCRPGAHAPLRASWGHFFCNTGGSIFKSRTVQCGT